MKANALLGFDVAGITPGYGNLTKVGIGEQPQLAARLLQRLPAYLAASRLAQGLPHRIPADARRALAYQRGARHESGSLYYDFDKLEACYGRSP